MANNTPPSEKEIFRKTNIKGTDRPTLELLNRYVEEVAPKWYELGMVLLSSYRLDDIRNHNAHIRMCCKEVFRYWLYEDVHASWNKLIAALEWIHCYTLAKEIRRNILKETGDDVDGADQPYNLDDDDQPRPKREKPIDVDDDDDDKSRHSSKDYDDNDDKKIQENLKYTLENLQEMIVDSLQRFDTDVLTDKKVIDGVLLLLMVVNLSEFYAAMYYFSTNETKEYKDNIYYIGKWGEIPAALVQTSPGRTQQLTLSSISLFKDLKVIVALGVCGTLGRLGDVIVSSRIDEYGQFMMRGDQMINKGIPYRPGINIYEVFMANADAWSFQCTKPGTEEYKAVAVSKPILSGHSWIASREYRDKLIASFSPGAGGIEMEGIGVIEGINIAEKRDKIEFIIVKAGCNYADEGKYKEWQPVAAMAAANFVYCQLNTGIGVELLLDQDEKAKILEIMSHAKENKLSIKARHSKVLFCGSSGSGKTNFINLLLNKDFVKDHKSTGATESHQLLAEQVTIKPASGEKKHNFEVFNYRKQIECLQLCLLTGRYHVNKCEKDAVEKEKTSLPTNSKLKLAETRMQQDTGIQTHSPSKSDVRMQETSTVKDEIASVADTPPWEPPDVWDILTFLDTGGQPEFITMLPAVNTSAMITFIVHSMEGGVKHLTDYVEVYEDGKKGEHPLDYKYSELIKMLFSIRNVKIEQIFEDLLVDKDKKSNRKCYLSLVGTKSDLVKEKIDEVVKSIQKELDPIIKAGKRESLLMQVGGQSFVPVTNLGTANDKRDPMADKFRNCIYDCLQKRDVYHIPIVWLILELEIQRRTQEKNKKVIHFSEIVTICEELDLIESKEDIRIALQFLHQIGVFLYYGSSDPELKNIADIVITNYQWVFENLTQVVKAAKVFDNLRLNGLLEEQAISQIDWKLENVEIKYFLKLLEKLGIICPTKEDGCEYFMPCVLPTCNAENKQEILEKFGIQCKASHLLMQIVYEKCDGKSTFSDNGCYLFPTGVFCYLINQLLLNNPAFKIRLSSDDSSPCVFNNLITFFDEDKRCYVVLINELMYMKVELRQFNHETIDESVFPEIKSVIKSTLKIACEKLKLNISNVRIGFQRLIDGKIKHYHITKEYTGELKNKTLMYDINNEAVPLNESEKVWFSGVIDVPGVLNLTTRVYCHYLLWQVLNKTFSDDKDPNSIFVMAVGQQPSFFDYDITHEHAKLADQNVFQLLDCALSCGTKYSPSGSTVSGMWKRLLKEARPRAGHERQQAFEETLHDLKEKLMENSRSVDDYNKHSLHYYYVSLQPSDWYQWFDPSQHEKKEWTQINVHSENANAYQAGLYRDLSGSVSTYDKHSNVNISLKVHAVEINRPWLDLSILNNKNYTIGDEKGSWSTGKLNAKNKGTFALLSTRMIVAKDLTVTGSTEMENKAIADTLFSVGSNSDNKNNAVVIGYVCTLLPEFPH